jgi:UDP-N-acetylmuramoyl-L-alanyl-D-glutamate--2,6-diaminopimelate ligase
VNTDARDKEYFINAAKGHGEIILYDKKDIVKIRMKTKLIGEFNLENIAAAVSVARSVGIEWDVIREAVELFNGVPGRLEFIQKIPFSVIIDYAHTPDSLEKVYHTVKKSVVKKANSHKMICVLGSAGGGRDMWKRAVMGEIAAKYCDHIILTNEDPFDEDPGEILNHIEAGILNDNKKKVKKIIDRKEAIRAAVKMAKKGDAVIITGKGSEPYMRIADGKKISWNEKEIVAKILNHETIEI